MRKAEEPGVVWGGRGGSKGVEALQQGFAPRVCGGAAPERPRQ